MTEDRRLASRHPGLVSGSSWSPVQKAETWILKQVQHDGVSRGRTAPARAPANHPGLPDLRPAPDSRRLQGNPLR
jgi:hypothetical protein